MYEKKKTQIEKELDEEEIGRLEIGRGNAESHSNDLMRENWLMVYGTDPTRQVKIDTKFIKNIL